MASRWVEPREALDRYGDGGLTMAPPTYYTIWDLARFDSAQAVLEDASSRDIVAVQPRMQQLEGCWAILLPGDELFPSDRPVLGPTRVVMDEGGRWWVVDRSETAR